MVCNKLDPCNLLASTPQVAQDLLWAQLNTDVKRCCRGQQLPAIVRLQLVTLEAIWVNLRQEVGADVTRNKARVGDDFTKEGNVVGHTWRENYQTLLKKGKKANFHLKSDCVCYLAFTVYPW